MIEPGFFVTGLLTGLREGVEAALIVAIVLAYLVRTGNGRHLGRVMFGVGAAVVLSVVVGIGLFVSVGEMQAPYEQLFEALTMLLAATVVTWMLFWMRRQAASVRGDLQAKVERALGEGSVWAMIALAFTAVIREGIETALFLAGQATSADSGASSVLVGALVGLLVAIGLGYGFYRGARVLDLRVFFRWTGIALIFIAAGLVSRAVHELVEIGVIGIGAGTVFDVSALLPHEEGPGQFLRAILGYTSRPEWITLVTWAAYVVGVLWLYLRPMPPSRPLAAEVSAPVGG